MTHSPALKSLLFDIRQHAAFEELKKAVDMPHLPRFRPSKADTLETMGARTIFESGRMHQHECWLVFLAGQLPGDTEGEP
jgi:hypothetical protein